MCLCIGCICRMCQFYTSIAIYNEPLKGERCFYKYLLYIVIFIFWHDLAHCLQLLFSCLDVQLFRFSRLDNC